MDFRKSNMFYIALAIVSAPLLQGCNKDEIPANVEETTASSQHTTIVYIADNDVFTVLSDGSNRTRLTTDGTNKIELAFRGDKQAIAYVGLNSNGDYVPFIIDMKGNLIEEVALIVPLEAPLRWAPNNQTLYYVDGNTVIQHGPTVNFPTPDMQGASHILNDVLIMPDNAIVYSYTWYVGSSDYFQLSYMLSDATVEDELTDDNLDPFVNLKLAAGTNKVSYQHDGYVYLQNVYYSSAFSGYALTALAQLSLGYDYPVVDACYGMENTALVKTGYYDERLDIRRVDGYNSQAIALDMAIADGLDHKFVEW